MTDTATVFVLCGLWLFIFIILIAVMYYFIDRKQRKRKFKEYEYPGRRRKKERDRSKETAVASFKDLWIDLDRLQSYKIFITVDKVYIVQFSQTDGKNTWSSSPYLFTFVLDLIVNIFFKKQVQELARNLDRRRLEKTNSMRKLLERTNFFYEIERPMVEMKLDKDRLKVIHDGFYRYGKKVKGKDDFANEEMAWRQVEFYFDDNNYREYRKLVRKYFP